MQEFKNYEDFSRGHFVSVIRTNRFKVNDEERFRFLMSCLEDCNDDVSFCIENGFVSFSAGDLLGVRINADNELVPEPDCDEDEEDDIEHSLERLYKELQSLLADGEVCVIETLEYEGAFQFNAYSTIITQKEEPKEFSLRTHTINAISYMLDIPREEVLKKINL